ncbi:MarR family transcriptional regulator [Cryobacterium melibiosiphilum]|uniref:MarR family transcriptional regulator n=1 Tax=Cryobacterium melibiosiphilum TaxID=995039 RepID=A0A3A5MSG1_9MICO|nr:MarR family transcriptional regulator [Cryobacterium melibiosiphilum]RJT92161.1 MarR family transcriptional regulator [Cryobacterium melibiosiphilum]
MNAADPIRRESVAQVIEAVVDLQRHIQPKQPAPFRGHRLSNSHLGLLFVLSHRSQCTPSDLAAHLQITPGAVTQLVTRLRDAELVVSIRHPDDSRSVILTLTEAAQVHVAEFESSVLNKSLPLFDSLSDAELATLATLLHRAGERT